MSDILKCTVCGMPSNEDKYFKKKSMLCNKHYLQMKRHGMIIDPKRHYTNKDNKCFVCGDANHNQYYIWQSTGELEGKTLCGKHYNQMLTKGMITDNTPSEHINKGVWTEEEINTLKESYAKLLPIVDICELIPNHSEEAIYSKAERLGLTKQFIRKNNLNYKAVYQSYDWCYERYIVKGMTMEEMAEEAGCKVRTIQKWCGDIYGINGHTFKKLKKLNDKQREVILFGRLGDGHIDKREGQACYIESHAEDQKDYLFWKYDILKDICNIPPTYYPSTVKKIGDKECVAQPSYRMTTRLVDELILLREIPRIDIINKMNEFGLSVHALDDGSRTEYWSVCLAEWTDDEVDTYIRLCLDRFGLKCKRTTTNGYIYAQFDKDSSIKLDKIILNNIPVDLDIVKKKIINNKHIKGDRNELYSISPSYGRQSA